MSMKSEMTFTPPNISDFVSGEEAHMAGDAAFRDGTKYRFVMVEGKIEHLYLYEGTEYCRNDFAKRAPRKAQAVLEAALPLLAASVAQMHKRNAQQDAEAKVRNEAAFKKQKLEQAAPAMFEALMRFEKLGRELIPLLTKLQDFIQPQHSLAVDGGMSRLMVTTAQARAALKLAGGGE